MAIGIDFKKRSDKGAPDIWSPIAKCDVCGSEINDGRAGVYVYDSNNAGFQVPTIACQGDCHSKVETEIEGRGGSVHWNELYVFVGMLKGNVMMKSEPADKELADEVERDGMTL